MNSTAKGCAIGSIIIMVGYVLAGLLKLDITAVLLGILTGSSALISALFFAGVIGEDNSNENSEKN